MLKLVPVLLFAFWLTACSVFQGGHHGAAAAVSKDTARGSLPYEVRTSVGKADIRINYYSPAVRGRIIWGGLVPYDAVWVAGAHNATALEVSRDFQVGGQTIKAGKYAIFTIPGREEWTVIINKRWNQHLADDYKETEDLVRINVKPQATENITERLKYGIEQTGDKTATISISWEKLRVPFELKIL
jgi:hypothetical protein